MKESDKIGTLAAILTGQLVMTMFYASKHIDCSTVLGRTFFACIMLIVPIEWGIGLYLIIRKKKPQDSTKYGDK